MQNIYGMECREGMRGSERLYFIWVSDYNPHQFPKDALGAIHRTGHQQCPMKKLDYFVLFHKWVSLYLGRLEWLNKLTQNLRVPMGA